MTAKKFFLTLPFLALSLASCNKEPSVAVVEVGSIRYGNGNAEPYKIYLDGGEVGRVAPNSTTDINNVQVGSHILKAVQDSNVLLFPRTKEITLTVKKGEQSFFAF